MEMINTNLSEIESFKNLVSDSATDGKIDSYEEFKDSEKAFSTQKWDVETREEILSEVKNYLYLYLYKEAGINEIKNSIANLTGLRDEDISMLQRIHFLLSPQVQEFLSVAKKLVRNLSHSTVNQEIISRGMIRGSIDWGKTYEERSKEGFKNKSIFSCKTTNKIYDLPENQLFKFLLNKIAIMTKNTSDEGLKPLDIKESDNEYWHNTIIEARRISLRLKNKSHMRDISDIDNVTPKMVRKTFKNKNNGYKAVVNCYLLYRSIFHEDDDSLHNLIELISNQVLKPLNDNKLFEIYVLFKLMDAFPKDYNRILKLMHRDSDFVSQYSKDNQTINLYYQNLPEGFGEKSKRLAISSSYNDFGIGAGEPDIIVEICENDSKRFRLIEIKNSSKNDTLKRGLNEVYAYLKEYEDLPLADKMRGILIAFGGVGSVDLNTALNHEVAIFERACLNDYILRRIILGIEP